MRFYTVLLGKIDRAEVERRWVINGERYTDIVWLLCPDDSSEGNAEDIEDIDADEMRVAAIRAGWYSLRTVQVKLEEEDVDELRRYPR